MNAFSLVRFNATSALPVSSPQTGRTLLEIWLGRSLLRLFFFFFHQKKSSIVELSFKLPSILNGSQTPSPSQCFQEPWSPAGQFWELVQLHQAKHHAGMQAVLRQLGDEVQENLDSFPKSILKRPGKKRSCVRVEVYPPPPPPTLLPVDISALYSAATALKCPAGIFSWDISVQESITGGFFFFF